MTRAEKYLYVTHAVTRRVYGEELASEPSQFLNEMPLDLIEDLSRGKSWLSFARGSTSLKRAVSAAGSLEYEYDESTTDSSDEGSSLTYQYDKPARNSARRPGRTYPGKTYDSVESIEEFFRKRSAKIGGYTPTGRGSERGTKPIPGLPAGHPGAAREGSEPADSKFQIPKVETRNSKLETATSKSQ